MKQRLLATILLSLSLATATTANAIEPYKNAVKLTFLSWTSGSTKISYERAFAGIKQSAELCGSIIGAGYDKYHNDPLGFTVRYGHKFFIGDYNPEKPLMGFYLRPEAIYSHYNYTHTTTGERTAARMGSLLGTFGYQYCIGRFIADAWVGAGYAFGTAAETGYHHGFQLWNWFNTRNDNIALSFSIRLGYLW
ncbi:MAG: hypothetical protein II198_04350 [Bacteroidaceae bacterium]|nr:hypothetical protein [Bacteroidaceae bacterium]